MMQARLTLVLPVLGALAIGCAANKKPLSLTPRSNIKPGDYEKILEAWSREDRLYNQLESKLFVHATFHSPEFRKAFLLRHTDVYGRGSQVARRLALTDPESREEIEFFFSAFTTEQRQNDFEKEDSIWRVTLTGDGGEEVDGKIVKLKTTANLRVIYPYITDFADTYAVRFPRTDGNGRPVISSSATGFKLRFVSAIGEAVMEWRLKPTGSSAAPPAKKSEALPK